MSLVSCPVKLYPATTKANRISFHTLNRATGHRINVRPHDPETGEELERDKLVKGYEIEKGRYVVVEEEEIDKVRIPSSKTIEIEEFVDAGEIDPAYFESPYYLTPDGAVADETYRTIREAIAERGRVAIGRVVLSRRERLVAVQPRGKGMTMTTLRSRDEVRGDAEFFSEIGEGAVDKEMVDLAAHIIAKKAGNFAPEEVKDRYQAELLELMQAKMRGETRNIERPRGPATVINLRDALKRSLQAEGGTTAPGKNQKKRGRKAS